MRKALHRLRMACFSLMGGCLVAVSVSATLQAAEPAAFRAGLHDGFARIVVDPADPAKPIGYRQEVEGNRLTITFDTAVTGDVSRLQRVVSGYVRKVTLEGGTRLVVEMNGPHRVRDFRNENALVFDMRRTGAQTAPTPSINTRFGRHANFTRLVFDWRGNVGYRLDNQNGAVALRFSRPAEIRISDSALARARGFESASTRVSGSATEVDLQVAGRVRHFRDGFKVVVDVFDPPVTQARQAPEPESKPASAPAPVKAAAPEIPAETPVTVPETAPETAVATRESAPDQATRGGPVSLAAPNLSEQPEPAVPASTLATAEAAVGAPVNLLPVSLQPAPQNPAKLPSGAADLEVQIISELDGALLRFPFVSRTGAAIFRRGGSLWIVFDTLTRINTAQIESEASDFVREIEQIPHSDATILRLVTIPGYNALSVREGNRWEIVLAPQLLKPEDAMGVTTNAGSVPSVTVGPTAPATPLRLVDPEIGDELRVVPVYSSGEGVAERYLYPDFRLLPSIQGVALVPLSDRIELRAGDDRIIISASGGLRLTDASARNRVLAAGGGDELERMFRFTEWRHAELGDLESARRELLAQIFAMSPENRNAGRMALARFNLAHGLADRTVGLLEVIAAEDLAMTRVPSFKALRGAANFLMSNIPGAERDLFDRELDAEPEIELWRAAVRAAQGDIVSASIELQVAERFVQDYPDALRIHFAFLGTEIALASGDPVAGEFWLEVIGDAALTPSQRDRQRVFQAEIAGRNGEIDTAVSLYERTIEGNDRRSRAIAALAKAELLLSEEDISPAEAVDELDRLRYVWRGDGLEFKILRRLGELEVAAGRYRDGLRTLKRAAANFPEHPAAAQMANDMRSVFERLYLDGDADEMEPVRAIALFNEFRELAPAGTAGDEMIRRLADRLVAVDLLDNAAELLTHQVEFRLEGVEKSKVGTRLAMIQLLNRKPQLALEALDNSEISGVLPRTERERSLARGRAYSQLGDFNRALATLASLNGDRVDLLRAEIHWKARDWNNAANVFARLGGAVPEGDAELSDKRSRYVLNRAVALALGGESRRLAALGRTFGPAMEATLYGADFTAITSVETAPRDFAEVLERVSQVDDFMAFMDSYRARLSGGEDDTTADS